MTALDQYRRLEAQGLWRPAPDVQRADVIVSLGEATLTLTDMREKVLAHWSLAAVARANPGQSPALYYPDGDPGETLELADTETTMIEAIETLRRAVARQRPRPGRVRLLALGLSLSAVLALGLFWLPDAVRRQTVTLVPDVTRVAIGATLREHLRRVTGPACAGADGPAALSALARRLPGPGGPPDLFVVRDGPERVVPMPGGAMLISRALVEGYDTPDVLAGHVVAAHVRNSLRAPLDLLLDQAGLAGSLRLLATGQLSEGTLRAHAEWLLTVPPPAAAPEALVAGFGRFEVPSTPYGYALDRSGETTLALIEADPVAGDPAPAPVLNDADWLRLQEICGD